MLQIGEKIGKYKILHEIGHGGMSVVYLAINERANQEWAIKEVQKTKIENNEVRKKSLIAETKILKKLRHPKLPRIIDIEDRGDTFLILMDYIEGVTLLEKLKREGAQSEEDVIDWAIQMCEVLTYLHTQDPPIIYRDIKPSNIMLKPNGEIVLIDFGTAREYRKQGGGDDTSTLGTKGYAAPEQYGGHGQTDARTDIFCLGATMYHLLTNHNPGVYPYEMYPIRKWDESLSAGLEAIILKCTKPNPDERYQSAVDLMYALRHYKELDEEHIRRRKRQKTAFTVFALLAAASFAFAVFSFGKDRDLKDRTFEAYIKAAQTATSKEAAVRNYKNAINLLPSSTVGYTDLLTGAYLDDGVFTREEADDLISVLGYKGRSGRSNEESLKLAPDYGSFAYQTGLAYYYYYETDGNKVMALPWFSEALQTGSLTDKQRTRAEILHRICTYYAELGRENKAGDSQISYRDYFNDLNALTEGNLAEEDNTRTALVTYKEFAHQMNTRAYEMKRDGVTEADIRGALAKLQKKLSEEFVYGTLSDDDLSLYDSVRDEIASAENKITLVFG